MSEEKISLNSPPPSPAVSPQSFVVPTELIPLPSAGLIYPQGTTLHQKDAIEIRSMTARDEDILTSRALVRSGKVIGMLLRSCIVDKAIDPEKMLVGDRNAALIGIRITGYGPEYPIKLSCPSCTVENKMSVNLLDLPIKRFPEGTQVTPGVNEFRFSLPVSKKTVIFKMLTGEEERDIIQIIERGRKVGGAEELVTTRLKMQILQIGDEKDPSKLSIAISNLPARDSRDLRKYIDSITPGVEMRTKFVCTDCGHEGEVEVPFGTDFFWPET